MKGYFCCRWRIGLKDTIFLPFFLVFLLDSYKGISFFGLYSRFIRDVCIREGGKSTHAFQLFRLGNSNGFQYLYGGLDTCHDA
jgi:hypothetical protein